MYPGDWVMLSTTVPTSQGVTAGEHEGKTLGTFDYIECELAITTSKPGCAGLMLGVLMGKGIGTVANWEDVSGDVLANGDVAVIQNWGVHPQVRQAADPSVIGDYLIVGTTGGTALNVLTAASGTTGDQTIIGVALVVSTAYTRAAADHGGAAFISRLR
jgi:hypothetical protein